ncbi:MAG: ABC transporter permease subunit [Armatimonadota bacterium]
MKGVAFKQIRQLGPQLVIAFGACMVASVTGHSVAQGIVFGICAAIAAYMGLHTLADESDGQMRLLFSLPLSRRQIVGTKLVVNFVLLMLFWSISMIASSWIFLAAGPAPEPGCPFYLFSEIGILESALIFGLLFALFAFTSFMFRKPDQAAFVGLLLGLLGYPGVWYLRLVAFRLVWGPGEPETSLIGGHHLSISLALMVIIALMLAGALWAFGRYAIFERKGRIVATVLLAAAAVIAGTFIGLIPTAF